MGYSLNRSFKVKERAVAAMNGLMARILETKPTAQQISDMYSEMIASLIDYPNSPQWVKSFIEGYWECFINRLWREHVDWKLRYRGVWLTSLSNRRTAVPEGTRTTEEIPTGRWWEITQGMHFWIDSDKVFFDSECEITSEPIRLAYIQDDLRERGSTPCRECGAETVHRRGYCVKHAHMR